MGYRPDIDGLRAVAVLSVLFYHAHLGFHGGFVGVDVFFVVSGFLITGLLHKSITAGTFSYVDFWERRVRRLAPALAVLTVVVAIASPLVLLPEDLKDLGGSLIAQPLLLSNVYFWRVVKGGYFGDEPEIRPLLHTWSLGVEEQYYLLFPIALVLLFRYFPRRPGSVLFAGFAISAALSVWLTPLRESFAFFTLPTRAWELLMGGLLVFWLQTGKRAVPCSRWFREAMAWTGMAMIAGSVLCFRPDMPFPGSAALLPCLGTALVLLANSAQPLTWVGRLLSHPFAVRTGQISYSLYLWHWPLVAWCGYLGLLRFPEAKVLVCLASYLAAYASWLWVETPIRTKQLLPQRRAMAWVFAGYALVSIAFGQLYLGNAGFPQNWPEKARTNELRSRALVVDPMSQDPQPLPLGSSQPGGGRFLLWGDSHAMSLAPLLHRLGQDYNLGGLQLTATSSAPLLIWGHELASWDKSPKYKARWRELCVDTIRDNQIRTVFLSGYWASYGRPRFQEDLKDTIATLNARGVRVVMVCDFPSQPAVNSRNLRLSSRWSWLRPTPTDRAAHLAQNARVYATLEGLPQSPDFTVVDPAEVVLGWPDLTLEDGPLYTDSHHLSDAGALLLRPVFEPIFRQMQQDAARKG